jgi:hypothetical protein
MADAYSPDDYTKAGPCQSKPALKRQFGIAEISDITDPLVGCSRAELGCQQVRRKHLTSVIRLSLVISQALLFMQAASVSALEIAQQAICDKPVQVGNQSPLTDDTAGRVFHAELHELVDQFWIFYAGMLRRLGEVLILGNLGGWDWPRAGRHHRPP